MGSAVAPGLCARVYAYVCVCVCVFVCVCVCVAFCDCLSVCLSLQGVPYSSLLLNSINHPNADGMATFVTALLRLFE